MWIQSCYRLMVNLYKITETGFSIIVLLAVVGPVFITS